MISLINRFISKWKSSDYKIDGQIPSFTLMNIVFARTIMLIRGKFSGIKNKGLFFFSTKATVKSRSRLSVGRSVTIASGAYIEALSTAGVLLGDNVSVGRNTTIIATGSLQFLGKGIKVGNHVGLGTHSFYGCAGGIEIGDNTIIGDFVSFHAENHLFDDLDIPIRLQGVRHQGIKVGENCWIGAKATLLDGVVIENGCVIAACALLTAGVYTANGIYGGVPAKLIKRRGTQI